MLINYSNWFAGYITGFPQLKGTILDRLAPNFEKPRNKKFGGLPLAWHISFMSNTSSNIFDDSPTRGPPTGRRRDILNQKYDHIGVCLDAILSRAEKGMEEIRIAVAEAREAVEQRRHLILRNNVDEDDLDVNVVNDQGDYRLVLFTDASSQIQNNGPLFRYGLGIFLGCQNPENRALAAPLTCNRFFSFSFLSACTQIFTAFSQHDGSRNTSGLGGLQGRCQAGD